MAIRIQFAGDKSIGVGSRPPGAFSIFKPPGAAFPPAGTYYDTQYGVEYPIAEGGLYFTSPIGANPLIPNQTCDVDREHDGSGGIVYDWTTATNVAYKVMGTYWGTDTTAQTPSTPVEVPSGSGFYYDSGYDNPTYEHDGLGGWQNGLPVFAGYYANGTFIVQELSYQTEVPSGSGQYYDNGLVSNYVWNGSGGYTTATGGAYYNPGIIITLINDSTEVPSGSGQYYTNGMVHQYTWDGGGGYVYAFNGSYYSSGTFIYNDGTYDYYWDGSGGYYI
jgi:hypothetical protein